MKKILSVCTIFYASLALSQENNLVPDQNPSYLVSQNKYMTIKDSLQQYQNTTVQQTYKAYDWYTEKLERKQQRINNRRDIRLARAQSGAYYYPNYYNGYGYNSWNNPFRFRNYLPGISFRTGNWWFWF